MKMKKIISVICCMAMVAVLFTGCSSTETETETEETTTLGTAVVAQTVELQDMSAETSVSGSVSAGNEVGAYASIQAEILTVYVEVGDYVEEGDLICELDVSSYEDSLSTLRTNYSTAKASYDSQKILYEEQIAQAQNNLDNTKALFAIGAASQTEVDSAELTLLSLQTTMDNTLLSLSDSMSSLSDSMKTLQDTIAKGTVTAPISGTVTYVLAVEGSYASPSYALANISEDGYRKITASVSENLLTKIAVGDTVSVTIGSSGDAFEATISKISPAASALQLYTVELDAPSGTTLVSGMFATITFYTDTVEDAVVVPTEAILTDSSESYVFIIEDGVAQKVIVETGLVGDGITQITSGLSGGETLVTSGQSYLSDGDTVRIVEG